MPNEKAEEKVADEPKVKTSVWDETEAGAEENEETSEPLDETSASDKTDEAEESESLESEEADEDGELKSLLKETKSKDKDNVQKRIDQLTAQLKELKAENQNLKSKEPAGKEPTYTDAQLKAAMKKAFEDGDADLVWDIMDYRNKQTEKSLISRYEAEKKQAEEQYRSINNEWQKVTMDYSRVWEDEKGREIYAGAKKDLDITNEKSLLYQLAAELYSSVDEDGTRPYMNRGGQKAAVADALSSILRRKKISPVDLDKKKLERSLAKEKKKRALSGVSSSEGDVSETRGKPKTDNDRLAEYIAERKKHQYERTNR